MKRSMKKKMKKTAAVVLAASMAAGVNGFPVMDGQNCAVVVEAAEADENGFVIEGTVLVDYQGTAADVVIPDGITEIGSEAFVADKENQKLMITSVTFPDSVVKIQTRAFYNCSGLTSLELPSGLEFLGGQAFYGCSGLSSIVIPKSLVDADCYSINNDRGPFQNTNISTVTFEEGITTIASHLFGGLTSLKSIEIPDTVTTIEDGAFAYSGLESIVIGEHVTKIENHAFEKCENAVSLDLGANLEELGGQAFYGCSGITEVTIPKSLKKSDCYSISEEKGPFQDSGITTVTFEDKTTAIAPYLFAGVTNLKSIEIPDTVTTIGKFAFYASGLKSVQIGEYVTRIEQGAFQKCEELAEVKLNDYVEFLGREAFADCPKITGIHIPATLTEAETDLFEKKGPFANTGITEVTFEEGIKVIANNLFQSIPTLETIDIPSTVEKIGNYAFKNCTALKGVDITWSVFEIGRGAFGGCTALEAIHIPDNVDTIGKEAFMDCTSLSDVKLSERLTVIEEKMFDGDKALNSITIPNSVTEIKEDAFNGCSSLTQFHTTGSVSQVKSGAFKNTGFTAITVWEGLTVLHAQAFAECKNLTTVVLPDSLTEIGKEVFYGCGELAEVTFGTGLTTIESGTFSDCGSLKKVIFPYGVKEIKTDVFHNCTSLTQVTIPKTAETLVAGMFSYSKKVTVYGVEGSVAETYANEEGTNFEALTVGATQVELNEKDIVMYAGQTKKLAMNVTPVEFTDNVLWSVADESIVTVEEDGTILAHGVGETIVVVQMGMVSASCKITVMDTAGVDTEKDRIAVIADELTKAIKTKVATIQISDKAIAEPKAVVVRTEKLGNQDKAEVFKKADDALKTTDKYNTDIYALYDFSITNQSTGEDVAFDDVVEITVDVPDNMDAEMLAVVRIKNVSVQDADTEDVELLDAEVSENGETLTFKTKSMGVFAVIQTAQKADDSNDDKVKKGDVDGNGTVELKDAQTTLKAALNIEKLEGSAAIAADADGNGLIELKDAQKILKVALNIEAFEE